MLQIIIKEAKDFLRDKSNVFFFLIFPVLLVFYWEIYFPTLIRQRIQ